MTPGILQHMDARRFGALHPALMTTVRSLAEAEKDISPDRAALLEQAAGYVATKHREGRTAELIFICTHNSRRSHMSQVWAQAAAWLYGLDHVACYSGGTEATAFHPNALRALADCGFTIETPSELQNPHHMIGYAAGASKIEAWSKTFDDAANPQSDFAAVMTCSDADKACPIVPGADARFPIRYEDPKSADGTPEQDAAYAERCRQIGAEMLWMIGAAASIVREIKLKN